MFVLPLALAALGVIPFQAHAQAKRSSIRAVGEASVSFTPDQGRITMSVITQAPTAQAAASQNADQVTNLLAQIRSVIGTVGQVKTIGYSLQPNYSYPREGGPPTLLGFTATNTVEVTLGDLSLIGRLIDTAAGSGATTVGSPSFSLKDSQPAQTQALKSASMVARAHVDAIAAGLGVRVGALIAAAEGAALVQSPDLRAAAAATPIIPGLVEIRATVTVEFEVMP